MNHFAKKEISLGFIFLFITSLTFAFQNCSKGGSLDNYVNSEQTEPSEQGVPAPTEIQFVSFPLDTTALEGADLTFSAVVAGDGLTYQWQKDGLDIIGSTAADLIITQAQAISDSGKYTLIVTDINGDSAANSFRLSVVAQLLDGAALYTTNCSSCHGSLAVSTKANRSSSEISAALNNIGAMAGINLSQAQVVAIAEALFIATPAPVPPAAPIVIQIQSNPLLVFSGQVFTLTCVAGGEEPITYEWYKDGALLVDGDRVTGTSTNRLFFSRAFLSDKGLYTCRATNNMGSGEKSLGLFIEPAGGGGISF